MEVIFYLGLIYGGIFLIGWFISQIEKWNEERKSKIRDEIANELIEDKDGVQQTIDEYKKELKQIGYDSESEFNDYYRYFHKKKRYDELLGHCPKCKNGYLRIISGKYGKFIGCSSFPKCSFTKDIEKAKEEYKKEIMEDIIISIRGAY